MFAIKRDQRQKMGELAYVDRTVRFFRDYYLEHVFMLDDDELKRRVLHGIEKARGYGFTWESTIANFVANMFTINPEFDKQPNIHRVLVEDNPELPVNSRLSGLLGLVEDKDWDEAEKQCDPKEYWAKLNAGEAKEG